MLSSVTPSTRVHADPERTRPNGAASPCRGTRSQVQTTPPCSCGVPKHTYCPTGRLSKDSVPVSKKHRTECARVVLSGEWSGEQPIIPIREQVRFWKPLVDEPSMGDTGPYPERTSPSGASWLRSQPTSRVSVPDLTYTKSK